MPELITRTARLVPYSKRPKHVPSFVTAYSYEPLPDDAGYKLGSLYVVIEVLVSGRSSEEVTDLIIETIGDHYYNRAAKASAPLERFETAIKAVNQQLTEYVAQGNAAWIGKLSAVIAVRADNELHVTHTGSAEAYLYRNKVAARITDEEAANRPTTPGKTFSSIASGNLEAGERLLLATPALFHQLPLAKLRTILSDSSPSGAIAEIRELLRGGSNERIAALVAEFTTPELAALQVRSDGPSEINLGARGNSLEAAKIAAAPVAKATIKTGQQAVKVVEAGWEHAKPKLHKAGISAASFVRAQVTKLRNKKR